LAVKLYPCCYALQRPISALAEMPRVDADEVRRVTVRTPASSLVPLIHHTARTGLEGKFSLEYGIAAALLDGHPGLDSFTDEAVARPAAQRLMERVEVVAGNGGQGLLAGQVEIEVALAGGEALAASLQVPPGAPGHPLDERELEVKLRACVPDALDELRRLSWDSAGRYLTALA
jgi:2-methylcitrate dehydratase PrpD